MRRLLLLVVASAVSGFIGYILGNLAKNSVQKHGESAISNPAFVGQVSAPASQPEVGGEVRADPHPLKILDLEKFLLSAEALDKIRDDDQKYRSGFMKNHQRVFKTSKWVFRVVSCLGRQSMDSNATNGNGEELMARRETVQLPNGKWTSFIMNILGVFEGGGETYLICQSGVYQVLTADKLVRVVSFLSNGRGPSIVRGKTWADRFWEVHKSDVADFGGLLEYRIDEWKFYPYNGKYSRWVNNVQELGGKYVFCLADEEGHRVEFDPTTSKFTDQ
jgi:hypothetical protein